MSKIKNKKLRDKILALVKTDQNLRIKQWRKIQKCGGIISSKESRNMVVDLNKVDKVNTGLLKKIVSQYGWPTIPLVGKVASHGAWLLIQHATIDKKFMNKCLPLLKKAAEDKMVKPANWAYLQDRILTFENKKQIYGTQFRRKKDGGFEPFPIRDIKNLDKRRAEIGLDTFEEYNKRINKLVKK